MCTSINWSENPKLRYWFLLLYHNAWQQPLNAADVGHWSYIRRSYFIPQGETRMTINSQPSIAWRVYVKPCLSFKRNLMSTKSICHSIATFHLENRFLLIYSEESSPVRASTVGKELLQVTRKSLVSFSHQFWNSYVSEAKHRQPRSWEAPTQEAQGSLSEIPWSSLA